MLIKIEKQQVSATAAEALRYKKLREKLGSSENIESWRIDVSWFHELEEKLGLFGKITSSFLCPGNSGGVAHIFICGDELPGDLVLQKSLPADAYPMLIKIEKPQVSATAAEALRYKKLREKLGGDELLGAQVGFVSQNLNLFRNGIGFDCTAVQIRFCSRKKRRLCYGSEFQPRTN